MSGMGGLAYSSDLCNDVLVLRNNVQDPSYVNNNVLDRLLKLKIKSYGYKYEFNENDNDKKK
jgi:hypothetical protein